MLYPSGGRAEKYFLKLGRRAKCLGRPELIVASHILSLSVKLYDISQAHVALENPHGRRQVSDERQVRCHFCRCKASVEARERIGDAGCWVQVCANKYSRASLSVQIENSKKFNKIQNSNTQ